MLVYACKSDRIYTLHRVNTSYLWKMRLLNHIFLTFLEYSFLQIRKKLIFKEVCSNLDDEKLGEHEPS